MTVYFNKVITNKLVTEKLDFDSITAPSLDIESIRAVSAEIDSVTSNEAYARTTTAVSEAEAKTANIPLLITETLNCEELKVDQLNVPDYVITTLFAANISATQEVTTTTYTPQVHKTKKLTRSQKIAIALGVIAVVALITLTVVTLGTGASAAAPTAAFVFEASFSASYGSASAASIAALGGSSASLVGATAAVATGTTVAGIAGITLVASSTGAAGALVAHTYIPPEIPDPVNPVLRPAILNATYGKSFLSDMIFGTTSYKNISASYVNFLLVQNEVNGSYALPRLIGYNPQLGFFDDGDSYGGVDAYLSICTNTPYNTLRYQYNGNLAIYTTAGGAPTWESGTQVSSRQYKTNIRPIESALSKIRQIEGVRFNYKGDAQKQLGVIAQQVISVLEEAVSGDEKKGYRVRLERLIPLIIEGMKDVYLKQEVLLRQ